MDSLRVPPLPLHDHLEPDDGLLPAGAQPPVLSNPIGASPAHPSPAAARWSRPGTGSRMKSSTITVSVRGKRRRGQVDQPQPPAGLEHIDVRPRTR